MDPLCFLVTTFEHDSRWCCVIYVALFRLCLLEKLLLRMMEKQQHQQAKPQGTIVVLGDSFSGKATLCGYMLHRASFAGQFRMNEFVAMERGKRLNRGMLNMFNDFFLKVAVDVTNWEFDGAVKHSVPRIETSRSSFKLVDALIAGRVRMHSNIPAAYHADIGVIAVSAIPEEFHGGVHIIIAYGSGIRHIVFAVSKIACVVDGSDVVIRRSKQREIFDTIVSKLTFMAVRTGFDSANFCVVPYSVATLENVETPGFQAFCAGPTLIDAIDTCFEQFRQSLSVGPTAVALKQPISSPSTKRDSVAKCEATAVVVHASRSLSEGSAVLMSCAEHSDYYSVENVKVLWKIAEMKKVKPELTLDDVGEGEVVQLTLKQNRMGSLFLEAEQAPPRVIFSSCYGGIVIGYGTVKRLERWWSPDSIVDVTCSLRRRFPFEITHQVLAFATSQAPIECFNDRATKTTRQKRWGKVVDSFRAVR